MKKCVDCGKKINYKLEEELYDELFYLNFTGWVDGIGYYGYQDNGPLCAECVIERIRDESDED